MERILFSLFTLFYKVPFLRLLLRKTDEKLSKIYPYDSFGRKVNAAKTFLYQLLSFLLVLTAGSVIMAAGGVFRFGYVFISLIGAVLFFKMAGQVIYEKARYKFLCEITDYTAELRHAYFRSNDAGEAVYEAWESAGEIMKLHLAVIERYFESEEIPEEYLLYAPDTFILSLLAICRNVIKYGDAKMDGHSSFLLNLKELENDIFEKRLRMEKDRAIMRGTFFFATFPGLFMPLMERWGLAQIEDLNTFFSGPTGGFVRIACGIITLVIARMFFLMRGDEDTFFGFSFKREIKFYEGKLARYTGKLLSESFPGRNLREFYGERLMAAAFVIVTGFSFMAAYGFKPAYLALTVLSAAAASFYPYLELAMRGAFVKTGAGEEVATFRRLLFMLSAVPGIGAIEILTELERYSFYYKNEIGMCLDLLNDNEELAYEPLKGRNSKELSRLADDFYAIDKVGVKESFDDIPEQDHFYGKKRKQDFEILQGFKKNILEVLLYVPFTATVFMYLIIPFMYESMKSLGSFMDMTGAF